MRLTRIPVFLGILLIRCRHGTDSAANSSEQLKLSELPTVTNENRTRKCTNGTLVKEFINSLTRNFTGAQVFKQRTYARRMSRALSKDQLLLLYNELPKFLYSKEKLEREKRELVLEIGFGHGEHFIHQAKMRPNVLFFGVEVYLNGIANILKLALEESVTNILVYPNNMDYIFDDIPNSCFSHVYILFPDPWHKNKHSRKRFMNKDRIGILQTKLSDRGSFVFATDMEAYFDEVVRLTKENGGFEITNEDDYLTEPDNYIETIYHSKANAIGNLVKFLICKKIK